MKNPLLFGLVVFAMASSVQASMIGDNLIIRRPYPNLATNYAPSVSTTVVAGNSDAVSPQSWLYTINPEVDNIYIDFIGSSGFEATPGNGMFDGLQFLGFSGQVVGASIISSSGIGISGLDFDAEHVNLNLYGRFSPGSSINLHIETIPRDETPAVPEPSTMALLGLGAAGLLVLRKRAGRNLTT